ncbi:MAG: hypothetical protein EBS05_20015, partial [Proteobacteria bacterium]|nr:hypothetical protein [Pseudomonadota bacterium]
MKTLLALLITITAVNAADLYLFKNKVCTEADLKLSGVALVSGKVLQSVPGGVLVMTDHLCKRRSKSAAGGARKVRHLP